MTQQKEIEEAIKYFEGDLREPQVTEIHQKPLVNLSQRYLDIEGFPEEKTNVCEFDPRVDIGTENRAERKGYNQAIQDCKLALLKKMDGIEDVIANTNCHIPEIGRRMKDSFHPSLIENLAQAIKDYLTK